MRVPALVTLPPRVASESSPIAVAVARSGVYTRQITPGMVISGTRLSLLSIFGLFAVSSMLVCYALEKRSPWFILAFALSCALASAYGFLQGAWPFGLVEAVWSLVAAKRWWSERTYSPSTKGPRT